LAKSRIPMCRDMAYVFRGIPMCPSGPSGVLTGLVNLPQSKGTMSTRSSGAEVRGRFLGATMVRAMDGVACPFARIASARLSEPSSPPTPGKAFLLKQRDPISSTLFPVRSCR